MNAPAARSSRSLKTLLVLALLVPGTLVAGVHLGAGEASSAPAASAPRKPTREELARYAWLSNQPKCITNS